MVKWGWGFSDLMEMSRHDLLIYYLATIELHEEMNKPPPETD